MLILTRTTPFENVKKKTDGMSLFFADLDPAAVEVRELHKLGRAAVDTNMLFIDNLKASASDLIGGEGRGFHCLLDGLNPERILVEIGRTATIGSRGTVAICCLQFVIIGSAKSACGSEAALFRRGG